MILNTTTRFYILVIQIESKVTLILDQFLLLLVQLR
jgi:hypothetical protein